MELRWKLQTLRKDTLFMSEYVNKAKDLFNHLNTIRGLDFTYNSLITILTYKKKIPSLEEVFTMMHVY